MNIQFMSGTTDREWTIWQFVIVIVCPAIDDEFRHNIV